MILDGSPFEILAVNIATYSNNPDFFTIATTIIMPISTNNVLKSIWLIPSSNVTILNRNIKAAPDNATTVLSIFSLIISIITIAKIEIAIICCVFMLFSSNSIKYKLLYDSTFWIKFPHKKSKKYIKVFYYMSHF